VAENGRARATAAAPLRLKHEREEQTEYGFDEGERFDPLTFEGPPVFEGVVMPPPPIAPPPANTYPYPPNAETYARAQTLRWAQRILLDEFGEAKGACDASGEDSCASSEETCVGSGGRPSEGPRGSTNVTTPGVVHHDSRNWYERIHRVSIECTLRVQGKEIVHRRDWNSPAPESVKKMILAEPIAAFQSPALGTYHPDVRAMGHKAEDAALTACVEYVQEWVTMEHGATLDPFRDIANMQFAFEVLTKRGKKKKAKRRHEGGPDDRMNAFKAAITRVRGW
jgi:hypothetical protein